MTTENDATPPLPVTMEPNYTADFLPILRGLEAVRHRPGMYIGDTGTNGLHHLFKEIIDNSIDEVLAGHCTEINVVYGADDSLSVEDNGRGIPVDINKETGKTGVELVLTELHAGGKFGDGGYKVSGGLHGVGASCVNALSTWLECEVRRDGKIHRQRFERGVPTGPLTVVGKCGKDEHGTKVSWLADDTMFGLAMDEEGHLHYSPDRLRKRISELAYLNKEVSITFHDAHHGEEPEIYHYKRGIAEYMAFLNQDKGARGGGGVVYFTGRHEDTQIEVALQYREASDEARIFSFVNNIHLSEGGAHVAGFKAAFTRTVNKYARKNGFLKEGDANFTSAAVRAGLTAVISIRMRNPSFGAADKTRLTNPEMEGIVNRVVGKGLAQLLDANPDLARTVLDKIAETAH